MLTSLGPRHGEQRCRQVGFAHSLNKPVQREELRAVLLAVCASRDPSVIEPKPHQAAAQHVPAAPASRQPQSITESNVRILLAEDNFTNQQVALGFLKKMGLCADAVADGAEAVKALQTTPYDLVLMDMRMPVMDGVEATKQIRDPHFGVLNPAIPIVAMTANVQQTDRDRCRQAGMNDFVPKPVAPGELRAVLERWLSSRDVSASVEAEAGTVTPAAGSNAMTFDRAGILKRMMGDESLVQVILQAFLGDIPTQIQKMKEYLQAGEA
jgi:CheY-like chemotaxis protein